jgi:flagellar biosynthesis protein FliR
MELSQAWLTSFVCSFFRGLGVAALLPFGSAFEGALHRVIIAAGVGLLFADGQAATPPLSLAGACGDFLVGLALGMPWMLCTELGGMLGELFDAGRGQTIGALYDPLSGVYQSQMCLCLRLLVWASVLAAGALEVVLSSLQESLALIPQGARMIGQGLEFGSRLMTLLSRSFGGMLSLYLPFALLFLLVDAAAGFAAKVLPQAGLCSESFQVKSWLGLLLLCALGWGEWPAELVSLSQSWLQMAFR